MIRFGTYNLLNFGQSDNNAERQRAERVAEVIATAKVDVLAVQEVIAPDEGTAGDVLGKLAAVTGMRCTVDGQPAVAAGHKLSARDLYFHTGLMWKPETPLIPGTLRAFKAGDFWHSLTIGVFDAGGARVAHASHHATPFGRGRRADVMERVVSALTRPDGRPAGAIGGDWNGPSADFRPDGSRYDPDWHRDQPWYPDLIYQCEWDYDESGRRRHWMDRRPGEVLFAGGLEDAAAITGAPWEATVGHWPDNDPFGARRIDAIKVTGEFHPALTAHETIRTPLALAASDHLPVVATYDPARIASGTG